LLIICFFLYCEQVLWKDHAASYPVYAFASAFCLGGSVQGLKYADWHQVLWRKAKANAGAAAHGVGAALHSAGAAAAAAAGRNNGSGSSHAHSSSSHAEEGDMETGEAVSLLRDQQQHDTDDESSSSSGGRDSGGSFSSSALHDSLSSSSSADASVLPPSVPLQRVASLGSIEREPYKFSSVH
jgi:hypothetical protein